LIRVILGSVLGRFERATAHSAPSRLEWAAGHAAYLVGLVFLAWVGAGLAGRPVPVGVGTVLALAGLGAGLGFLFLLWAVQFREVTPEPWFVSHLAWLSVTYAAVFAAIAAGTFGLVLMLFLAAAVPALAPAMVYVPTTGAGVLAIWFAWRMLRGYWSYWRRATVGHLVAGGLRQ